MKILLGLSISKGTAEAMPLQLKINCNRRAFSNFTVKFDCAAVIGYGVFHDRKSKTGATGFFGMAFIYTIEAFKDTTLMLGRNTYTGIVQGR